MMTAEQRIRDFLAATMGRAELVAAVGDDDSLIDSGVVNSLGLLELAGWVESDFGIRVDELDLVADNFESVAAIARFVRAKGSADAAG
jgi:acyl carrier protein